MIELLTFEPLFFLNRWKFIYMHSKFSIYHWRWRIKLDGIEWSRNLSVTHRSVMSMVVWRRVRMECRIASVTSPLCICAGVVAAPQVAKQSLTYNKYYTYLTYVWCRHVLFIALDSKIIGENGFRFLLFLFDEFIVFFFLLSFPNFTYIYCCTVKHEQNCELLFEHVCKIKAPTKCDAPGEIRSGFAEQI